MKLDEVENVGIIAAIAGGVFLLWKSGVFKGLNLLGKGVSYVESGAIGSNVANIPVSKGTVATSNTPITFGEIAVTSNPFNFVPNLITAAVGGTPSSIPSLNVSATDNAFSKIGMTTAGVVKLENQIGDTAYAALEQRLINNQLSDADRTLLYSAGWDGTCQYWTSNNPASNQSLLTSNSGYVSLHSNTFD
jgi:hypothetical protein